MTLNDKYNSATGLLKQKIGDIKNDQTGTIDDKLARIKKVGELNSILDISDNVLSRIDSEGKEALNNIAKREEGRASWSDDRKQRFDDRKTESLQSYFEAEVSGLHIFGKKLLGSNDVVNSAIELAADNWETVTGFKPDISKFKLN